MVKIVLPILGVTFIAPALAGSAAWPDCDGFPDFRARVTCYELVSRAPPERAAQSG